MRIGINTLGVMPGRSGGDGTYTRSLVEHLCRLDEDSRYYLFVAPYNRVWFASEHRNVHLVECPIPPSFVARILYEQTVLPVMVNRLQLDVFHAPVNIAPLLLKTPYVLSVHDSIYNRGDVGIPLPLSLYWKTFRPRSAARAARIVVMSETNRYELLAQGAVPPNKVEVIYNGVHERFRPLDRHACRAWARREHELDRPYVLWVGRPYASKNLGRMVEAFARFNEEAEHRYLLVLAGPSGWEDKALREVVNRTGIEPHLRQLGYVPNEYLPQLYNAAEALLFPSLHESFAFPVVEAMACGTPVITSNVSALPEVTDGAAELVDPLSVDDIVRGLHNVLFHPARWEELQSKGRERAALFSWPANAARILALYEQIA